MSTAMNLGALGGLAFAMAATGWAQSQSLTLTPPPLPYGTIGANYNTSISATGGSGNYHFAVVTGNLPPGLQLADTGSAPPIMGHIFGAPTAGGTYNFTIKVSDSQTSQTGTQAYSIGVMQISTPAALPGADAGTMYSLQFQATDAPGPFSWSAPGAPAGMSMSTSGLFSGIPAQPGTYQFNVTAVAGNVASATKAVTFTVLQSLIIITSSPLAASYAGTPLSINLQAAGGKTPYTWSVGVEKLPDGLTLTSTGLLSGTPTTPSPAGSPYIFHIQVKDPNGGMDVKQFSLTIYGTLSIATPTPLPSATINVFYTQTFQGAGGLPPYIFGIVPSGLSSGVPPGMTLSTAGVLSGTPTVASVFSFIVKITDANGVALQQTYSITVGVLAISTPSPLPAAQVGAFYSQTLATSGGAVPYSYALTGGALPPGISLSPGGVLAGTPAAAGTFSFTITSTDAVKQTATKAFQLMIGATGTSLQANPGSLSYTSVSGSDSPIPQYIEITSVTGAAINFVITVDNGSGGAAPPWINVFPLSGTTPARITVTVDPLTLSAASYPARVRIQIQGATTFLDIPITQRVVAAPPDVIAYPTYLRFEARVNAPKVKEESLLVVNRGGGGGQTFQMTVNNNSSWLSLAPATGTTAHNSPVVVLVKVNTTGLAPGLYRDSIHFVSVSATYDIPVSVYVAPAGSVLRLSNSGLQFQVKQGAGGSDAQTIKILNTGDPGTSISWRADLLQGSAWVSVSPTSGVSTPTQPGLITIVPGAGAQVLASGGYYAVVRFTDTNGNNTPQFLTAVLDVLDANSGSTPDLSPAGLVFRTAPQGGTQNQQLLIYTSDLNGAPFQAAANTADGGNWLSVSPASGVSATRSAAKLTVTVNPAQLANGVYSGEIAVTMPGGLRTASVTLVVGVTGPTGSATPVGSIAPVRSDVCSPTKLVVTNLTQAGEFLIKAGFPIFVLVQLYDDCNNAVQGADVVVSFSNGDLPLTLFPDPDVNLYTATWQPGSAALGTTLTFRANLGDLSIGGSSTGASNIPRDVGAPVVTGAGTVTGDVVANPSPAPPPFLNACGVVNNTNVVPCGGLAPGTVSSVYGENLAPAPPVSPGILPLPTQFNGTQVLVGGIPAPMFYLGPNQINIELPTELVVGREYEVLVISPGGVTAPDPIVAVPVSPGVAALLDGHINAQHGNGTSITAANPAKPGEQIAMYLTGLGATNPPVATGDQAPGNPVATLQNAAIVTVDGQGAFVNFSGLTPGGIGLYQINFTIPPNARTGDLNVIVSQGGVQSNVTKLPVSQ